MEKILVPTDFSDIANNALEEAVQIAKKTKSGIVLLTVIEEGSSSSVRVTGQPIPKDLQENIFMIKLIEKRKQQLADIINQYDGITIFPEMRLGSPFQSISEIVSEQDVELIVMGTKGISGFEELVIGSNTEKVVRHARCPVLSVHDKSSAKYENIVFATSMSDKEEGLIKLLRRIQTTYDSKLHLVWVNTPNNFERDKLTKERMKRFVDKYNLNNCSLNIYNDITEEDGIICFAEEQKADIIAMITHGRTGFAHLIAGSIAEDVVNHTKRPVLTYSINK